MTLDHHDIFDRRHMIAKSTPLGSMAIPEWLSSVT